MLILFIITLILYIIARLKPKGNLSFKDIDICCLSVYEFLIGLLLLIVSFSEIRFLKLNSFLMFMLYIALIIPLFIFINKFLYISLFIIFSSKEKIYKYFVKATLRFEVDRDGFVDGSKYGRKFYDILHKNTNNQNKIINLIKKCINDNEYIGIIGDQISLLIKMYDLVPDKSKSNSNIAKILNSFRDLLIEINEDIEYKETIKLDNLNINLKNEVNKVIGVNSDFIKSIRERRGAV